MEEKVENEVTIKYPYKIPLLQLFILHVSTFGLYAAYWFYRNWKYLKEHNQIHNVKPGLLTIGLFIPIYNLYLFYDLFNNIKKYADEVKIKTYKYPSLLVWSYVGIFIMYVFLSKLFPSTMVLIIAHSCVAMLLIKVQSILNSYWENEKEKQLEIAYINIVDCLFLIYVAILIITEAFF